MQAQGTNKVQWATLIAMVLILLGGFFYVPNLASDSDVEKAISDGLSGITVTVPDVDVPTAKEIADEINIESADAPTVPASNKINDLWEDLYADEIEELEDHAYDDVLAELEDLDEDDMDDLVDFLEANIDGFDELVSVSEDDDETNVEIINLNPDNDEDEDKEAEVYLELKVKYRLSEGQATSYKETVYVFAEVAYEEGDFDEEEVEVTYSL